MVFPSDLPSWEKSDLEVDHNNQYLRQIAKIGKNGLQAKNQLIDFIGLSKTHFGRK
jgi:hypothetical protein